MDQASDPGTVTLRRRPFRIHVRFTQEEYQHVRELAEIANIKPATLLRALSMGERLHPIPRFPQDVQRAIKSLGGNLNQLAHQANMGRVDRKEVEELRESVNALLHALRPRPCRS